MQKNSKTKHFYKIMNAHVTVCKDMQMHSYNYAQMHMMFDQLTEQQDKDESKQRM